MNSFSRNLHALQRMKERLDSYEMKIVLERTIEACRKYGSDSIGVIAHRLDCQRNNEWSNTSNGNCVLVIVRDGQIKTVYLRRSSQTFDLELTRTRVLVDMTKTIHTTTSIIMIIMRTMLFHLMLEVVTNGL